MKARFALVVVAIAAFFGAANYSMAVAMTFSLDRTDGRSIGLDLYQLVYAEGQIASDTGEQFRAWSAEQKLIPGAYVYFNSPGGSVIGGLQLGQAIRDLGFETDIGKPGSQPGYCLSACAYAYLGGVFRFMNEYSTYGVHRFSGSANEENAQILSGILTQYIERMGAKPTLFSLMTVKGSDEILSIPLKTLVELNVVNNGIASTVWDIQNIDSVGFYLRGTTNTNRGEHKLMFICNNRKLYGYIMLNSPDPPGVVKTAGKINWIVNREWLAPLAEGVGRPIASPGYVSTIVEVEPALYRKFLNAESVGFAWQNRNGQLYSGFEIPITDGAAKLRTFARTCNLQAYP